MFAEKYLKKNKITERLKEFSEPGPGIIVVIPCYREPEVQKTLQSLFRCRLPQCRVEVLVLINNSESAPDEIKVQNLQTKIEVGLWIKNNYKEGLQFYVIGPVTLKNKWAGAGMARKAGMDEAVFRFNRSGNSGGIIVSLDADTLVEENYFIEIEKYFKGHPLSAGATIRFEHQKQGLGERHLHGILLYEKYMDYYKRAMGFTGYPYPMFTVGSAFAVTAGAYVKRGGMNRRQAGEDFYFLQNLVQVGTVGEIKSTTVHPSARLSDRVPFGTGPVLQKWVNGEEELRLTYRFEAYTGLKSFFDRKDVLFRISREDYKNETSGLPLPVKAFLDADNFWMELEDLNRNCASRSSFHLRFFHKFNAFRILKYLNFSHTHYYEKADLDTQFELLEAAGPD